MSKIPERVWLSADRQWAKSQTPICTDEYVRAADDERDEHVSVAEMLRRLGARRLGDGDDFWIVIGPCKRTTPEGPHGE